MANDGQGSTRSRNLVIALIAGAAIVAALIVASLVIGGGDDESSPNGTTGAGASLDGIEQDFTYLGNPDAKVTLIEYADLQCPICKEYSDNAFPDLVEEYVRPGDVRMEMRGLAFIGPDSEKALRFVLAAGLQDRAWHMQELLFQNQGGENAGWVTDELVRDLAGQIEGLDVDKLFADVDDPAVTAEIDESAQQGSEQGVQGTPWFFIQIGDDEPYFIEPSSLTADWFAPVLDDALSG